MNITLYTIGILLFLGTNLIILIIKEKKLKNKKQKYAKPKYSDPTVLSKTGTKMLIFDTSNTSKRNRAISSANRPTLHFVGVGKSKIAVPKMVKKSYLETKRRLRKSQHVK